VTTTVILPEMAQVQVQTITILHYCEMCGCERRFGLVMEYTAPVIGAGVEVYACRVCGYRREFVVR
jgi:hypothetical protein